MPMEVRLMRMKVCLAGASARRYFEMGRMEGFDVVFLGPKRKNALRVWEV